MCFFVAFNTSSMGFLLALITYSMEIFVALKQFLSMNFVIFKHFKDQVYMYILIKCKLIVKDKNYVMVHLISENIVILIILLCV